MAINRNYQPDPKPPAKKAKAVTNGWSHSGLIEDLCVTVNGSNDYICGEVYAGSRFLERRPCPDALRIRMSYTRPDFAIYEIKVSRPDFLSDIRSDKWQTYLPYCSRFYFATPDIGVATIEDIPFVAGWMVRGANGWRTVKTPKVREFTPDFHYALALLISEQKYRVRAEVAAAANRKLAHGHNVNWSTKIVDRVKHVEDQIRNNWASRKKIISARNALKKHFGIDIGDYWRFNDMDSAFKDMKTGLSEQHVRRLRQDLADMTRIINDIAGPEKPE